MSQRRYPWESDGETLVLETPEQTKIEYELAPFGSRIVAALLDRLIIIGVILGICGPLWFLGFGSGFVVAAAIVIYFLVSMFYFVWAEVAGEGRTAGKRRVGLRTVAATGHGLSPGASLVRNLARVVDDLPPFWLVPMLAPGRQRIGDLLAGTFVISQATTQRRQKSWIDQLAPSYRDLPERRFPFSPTAAEKLFADDLNLLEYLDDNLRGLRRQRRAALLAQIAEKYIERLDLVESREAVLAAPERFLQELALFLRLRLDQQPY
jgi:uncharacterized RDD family membrane protein YckC